MKALYWLARALIVSLFILGGINKLLNFQSTAALMEAVGIPLVTIALPLTIIFELGGGLWVLSGRRHSTPIAVMLAAYTIVINVLFHDFWNLAEPERALQLSLFFKNVSIAGGLLMLAWLDWQASSKHQPDAMKLTSAP